MAQKWYRKWHLRTDAFIKSSHHWLILKVFQILASIFDRRIDFFLELSFFVARAPLGISSFWETWVQPTKPYVTATLIPSRSLKLDS